MLQSSHQLFMQRTQMHASEDAWVASLPHRFFFSGSESSGSLRIIIMAILLIIKVIHCEGQHILVFNLVTPPTWKTVHFWLREVLPQPPWINASWWLVNKLLV